MMASGIISGRRRASPPPANGCRRIASSGSKVRESSAAQGLYDRRAPAVSGDAGGRAARDGGSRPACSCRALRFCCRPAARCARCARHSCVSRRTAKRSGTPLLLPRMRPIGDLASDELSLSDAGEEDLAVPPPIPELRRRLLLTRLVLHWGERRGDEPLLPGQAAALAASLARLLDRVATEGRASLKSPIWSRRDWRSIGASSTNFLRSCRSIGRGFSPRRGPSTRRRGAIACWNSKPRLGAARRLAIR